MALASTSPCTSNHHAPTPPLGSSHHPVGPAPRPRAPAPRTARTRMRGEVTTPALSLPGVYAQGPSRFALAHLGLPFTAPRVLDFSSWPFPRRLLALDKLAVPRSSSGRPTSDQHDARSAARASSLVRHLWDCPAKGVRDTSMPHAGKCAASDIRSNIGYWVQYRMQHAISHAISHPISHAICDIASDIASDHPDIGCSNQESADD